MAERKMTPFPHTTPCAALKWCAIEGTVNVLWGRGNVSSAASIAQARNSIELRFPRPCKPWLMPKPICVYSYDANPTFDQPKFHVSRHDAEMRLELGSHYSISDNAIQELPPVGWQRFDRSASRFDEAWRMKPSGGVSVWQMRSQMGMSKDYVNE